MSSSTSANENGGDLERADKRDAFLIGAIDLSFLPVWTCVSKPPLGALGLALVFGPDSA